MPSSCCSDSPNSTSTGDAGGCCSMKRPCCGVDDVDSGMASNEHHDNHDIRHDAINGNDQRPHNNNNNNNSPYQYSGDHLYALEFPLGGIGTGNVMLTGTGSLQRWTVMNQTLSNGQTFRDNPMPCGWFGVEWNTQKNDDDDDLEEEDAQHKGDDTNNGGSVLLRTSDPAFGKSDNPLPCVKHDSLFIKGQYPIAQVSYNLSDNNNTCPLDIQLEALNPLIPGDARNSSLPCAIFTLTVTNTSDKPQTVRSISSLQNFLGWDGSSKLHYSNKNACWGSNVHKPFVEFHKNKNCNNSDDHDTVLEEGISLSTQRLPTDHEHYGTMTISAVSSSSSQPDATTISVIPSADNGADLWNAFVNHQDVPTGQAKPSTPTPSGTSTCCGVVQQTTIPPNATSQMTFIISWHFPNRMLRSCGRDSDKWDHLLPQRLGNHYATRFTDAQDVSIYVALNLNMLTSTTRLYRDTLYSSTTLSYELLESAAGRVAALRSPTLFQTDDGIVLFTEGNGCCPLNCTHVIGYTTLMERLFPSMARDICISNFSRTYDKPHESCGYCGGIPMRYGTSGWAIDGSLASIIKAYLVAQQDSDPSFEFLRGIWPNIKDQLQRIQTYFDVDDDGFIRGPQQNTYDSAMQGANTFIGTYYIAALKAVAAMAKLMEEPALAKACTIRAELAAQNYEHICWQEEFGYYVADVTEDNCDYSYGPCCFVDQLCGTGLASACGMGHLLHAQHEMQARLAICRYNQVSRPPFQDQQHHFYNGDTGIRVGTYPNGKLGKGMMYDKLVSTGFTSPVIAGLLLDGTPEALDAACQAAANIRRRHDGRTASPWNEPECGQLYIRAMAHWNIYDQACGFQYTSYSFNDMGQVQSGGAVSFDPRFHADSFSCFVTLHGGWGEYKQEGTPADCLDATCRSSSSPLPGLASGSCSLSCLNGSFCIRSLAINTTADTAKATLDDKPLQIKSFVDGVVLLKDALEIPTGSCLIVGFSTTSDKQKSKLISGPSPLVTTSKFVFSYFCFILIVWMLFVTAVLIWVLGIDVQTGGSMIVAG